MSDGAHTALVTGAGGFLGRSVTRRLAAGGWSVRALAAPGERLDPALPVADVHSGDITDPTAVHAAARRAELIVHLAAMYVFGPEDPARMWEVNVRGTEAVLAAATDTGAVVVHVSSASAMGRTGAHPEDESFWGPLVEPTAYELTKREAHLRALVAAASGTRVRIAAPTGLYGPGDASTAGRMLEGLARRPPPVFGPADIVQCPVHVDDVADGLARIAEVGRDGETYCIAGEPVTMLEWAATVCELAGGRRPVGVPARAVRAAAPLLVAAAPLAGMSRAAVREMLAVGLSHFSFSAAKLRGETGWSPRPLRDGLADLVARVRGRGG